MTDKKKHSSGRTLVVLLIIFLVAVIGGLTYLFLTQRQQMTELVEQMEIEKEELQEEYEDLAIQFDGYQSLDIRNDSLQDLLSREQQRVQDLLEELRQTKASNARKIAELKKELATVRTVMQDYVRQIDSLNATNARLTEENIMVRQENAQVKEQNSQLTSANAQLTETVTRAAMLEVTTCQMTPLNKRDHKTKIVSQIRKLQFDYTIARNITCTPGIKDLYVRITDPNGELFVGDGLFPFENTEIPYSIATQIEYSGEPYSGTVYLTMNTEVLHGYYTIDFFCENNLIGSFPFQIRK
jgi:hypothetical protein